MKETILFLVIWIISAPLAAALVATSIANEKVFAGITAWIDRRFRGSLIAYLVRCERCLCAWVVAAEAAACYEAWWALPFPPILRIATTAMMIPATVRISWRLI